LGIVLKDRTLIIPKEEVFNAQTLWASVVDAQSALANSPLESSFGGSFWLAAPIRSLDYALLAAEFTKRDYTVKRTDFYLEGANVIPIRRHGDSDVILISRAAHIFATASLKRRGWFASRRNLWQQTKNKIRGAPDYPQRLAEALETYRHALTYWSTEPSLQTVEAFGAKLRQQVQSMGHAWKFSDAELHMLFHALRVQRPLFLTDLDIDDASLAEVHALSYLAELDMVKDFIATELGVSSSQLRIVPSPFEHLDLFIKPIVIGSVLMPDPYDTEIWGAQLSHLYQVAAGPVLEKAVAVVQSIEGVTTDLMKGVLRLDPFMPADQRLYLNAVAGSVISRCQRVRVYVAQSADRDDVVAEHLLKTYGIEAPRFIKDSMFIMGKGGFGCVSLGGVSNEN